MEQHWLWSLETALACSSLQVHKSCSSATEAFAIDHVRGTISAFPPASIPIASIRLYYHLSYKRYRGLFLPLVAYDFNIESKTATNLDLLSTTSRCAVNYRFETTPVITVLRYDACYVCSGPGRW